MNAGFKEKRSADGSFPIHTQGGCGENGYIGSLGLNDDQFFEALLKIKPLAIFRASAFQNKEMPC